MFNVSRYNLQRFNLPITQETEVHVREAMVETFHSLITHGEDVYITDYGIERVNGLVSVAAGEIFTADMYAELDVTAAVRAQYYIAAAMAENVNTLVTLSEDCWILEAFSADVNNTVELGANEHLSIAMQDGVMQYAHLSADYYVPPIMLYEIIDSSISSNIFVTRYITIDAGLPPGATLMIDSDNYVVLLGDESAIHLHNGDWLNELSRSTYDIVLESGVAADLEGSILYTPRWL